MSVDTSSWHNSVLLKIASVVMASNSSFQMTPSPIHGPIRDLPSRTHQTTNCNVYLRPSQSSSKPSVAHVEQLVTAIPAVGIGISVGIGIGNGGSTGGGITGGAPSPPTQAS